MNIINQEVKLMNWNYTTEEEVLTQLEEIGRVSYKSWDKTTPDSWRKFIKMIIKKKHYSVLEHILITMKIKTNRAIATEFRTHRHFSFNQESTRYVKYDSGLTLIECDIAEHPIYKKVMNTIEQGYKDLRDLGFTPDKVRGILPNDLSAIMIVTGNLRSWIEWLPKRTHKGCNYQMLELSELIYKELKSILPTVFENV